MQMMEKVRAAVGGIDWIRAGQVLGVPAMGMLFLLIVGFWFVRAQSAQWAKDAETRQELLTKLVENQIDQSKVTTATAVRTQAAVEKLENIAEQQVRDHSALIDAQKSALKNHDKMMERDAELIAIQKQIRDILGPGSKVRPSPAPKDGGT